ncbi:MULTISPECIES: hypothetical protein [Stenotrophomonas]|uniref:hypothetical protein n=1 Tax=Stenotrophomonas TaxID=40323 RepID=UPI000ADEB662|nr:MULTISPECIES: hypothetical protein [Stenotrophomonas]
MKTINKHIKISERQLQRVEQQMAQNGMTFTDWVRNAIEVKLGRVETVAAIEEAKSDLLRTQEDLRKEVANLRLNLMADQKTFVEAVRSINEAMSEQHIEICKQHISGLNTLASRLIEGGGLQINNGRGNRQQTSTRNSGGVSFPTDNS